MIGKFIDEFLACSLEAFFGGIDAMRRAWKKLIGRPEPEISEEDIKKIEAFLMSFDYCERQPEEEEDVQLRILRGEFDIDKLLDDPEVVNHSKPTPEQRARFEARLEAEIARLQDNRE